MRISVFGLSVSSAWGNGHATLWRGLIHALARMKHEVWFFEWDAPYYAAHRDCFGLPNGQLLLYRSWEEVRARAYEAVRESDVVIVTSYCAHALEATALCLDSGPQPLCVFYDLDTPVTLARLEAGEAVPYIGARGLADYDLVLSYAGGRVLRELQSRLAARRVAPLYGSVDPALHRPAPFEPRYRGDLSYLGTYSPDRESVLQRLLVEPALRRPNLEFVIGGAQYPGTAQWPSNVRHVSHVPPAEHGSFYGSARLNLSVTRLPMVRSGFCPSARIFEVAACGAPLITDRWDGIQSFYEPEQEILIADGPEDVMAALERSDAELARMARTARERTLAEHTNEQRARELVAYLEDTARSRLGRVVQTAPRMEA